MVIRGHREGSGFANHTPSALRSRAPSWLPAAIVLLAFALRIYRIQVQSIWWDEGRLCTQMCLETCPPGWDCRAVVNFQNEPDPVFLCWPHFSFLCYGCYSDYNCDEGYCLTLDDGPHCSRPCSLNHPCPEGFACEERASETDPGQSSQQCVPQSGACSCGPWTAIGKTKKSGARND